MKNFTQVLPSVTIKMAELTEMSVKASKLQGELRLHSLAPTFEKQTPIFTQTELAELLGRDINWMSHRLRSGDEPAPKMINRKNHFTLEEARIWAKRHRKAFMRPEGQEGLILATGNFKGGSTKTTTAMAIAQGLSIYGHRVLAVDLDPQGSLSYLMGVTPELDNILTLAPVLQGTADSVEPMIRKTYWDGIDLIAASPLLSQADMDLLNHPSGKFWRVLRSALAPMLKEYDVVILDTGPTLSPLTATAFMAADSLIVPITPNALDFASSAQFWKMFADMHASLNLMGEMPKEYEFVNVLLSRVDANDSATDTVREFVKMAYGARVMDVEIPKTNVATSASLAFGTVFDAQINKTSRAAYQRAKGAYEAVVEQIDKSLASAWARRVQVGEM